MLVPEIVNKTKYGVVNGKIVPTGAVEVEQLVGYDISDFTEEGLRSLIQAGHVDYFDDSEKDKLIELGILEDQELDPQLTIVSCSNDSTESSSITCVISFLGNGIPTLTDTKSRDISYNAANKTFSFKLTASGMHTTTVSLTADPPYVAASVSYTWDAGNFGTGAEEWLSLAPAVNPQKSSYQLFNDNDNVISGIPKDEVTYCSVSEALKLSNEDQEVFLAAYDEAKAIEDKITKYFFWFDIPDKYKTEVFSWLKYEFNCEGDTVEVLVNGYPMEVVVDDMDDYYYAKLTEFGAVAIMVDKA